MATLVTASVPGGEFALAETLEAVPGVAFECERIVGARDATVTPLVWARGADPDDVDAALTDDASVETFDRVSTFAEEALYRVSWADRVESVLETMTTPEATVMDAVGDGRTWTVQVLFPDRESLSRTVESCAQCDLTFDVRRVRDLDGEPSARHGLTEQQRVALATACRRGYFEVPRRVDLDELAEDLGISHQSLSERLRRGHQALVEDTLLAGRRGDGREE